MKKLLLVILAFVSYSAFSMDQGETQKLLDEIRTQHPKAGAIVPVGGGTAMVITAVSDEEMARVFERQQQAGDYEDDCGSCCSVQ